MPNIPHYPSLINSRPTTASDDKPINAAPSGVGPSIRCSDCGSHIPWSKTRRHICPKAIKRKPLKLKQMDTMEDEVEIHAPFMNDIKPRVEGQNIPTILRRESNIHKISTWQNRRPTAAILSIDESKPLKTPTASSESEDPESSPSFQQYEIKYVKTRNDGVSSIASRSDIIAESDKSSLLADNENFDSNSDSSSILQDVPKSIEQMQDENFKTSWSWSERGPGRSRKFSVPIIRRPLPADVQKAVHSRSQSVPEITAAAKFAQQRRHRNRLRKKSVFDNLLSDIDEIMSSADANSDHVSENRTVTDVLHTPSERVIPSSRVSQRLRSPVTSMLVTGMSPPLPQSSPPPRPAQLIPRPSLTPKARKAPIGNVIPPAIPLPGPKMSRRDTIKKVNHHLGYNQQEEESTDTENEEDVGDHIIDDFLLSHSESDPRRQPYHMNEHNFLLTRDSPPFKHEEPTVLSRSKTIRKRPNLNRKTTIIEDSSESSDESIAELSYYQNTPPPSSSSQRQYQQQIDHRMSTRESDHFKLLGRAKSILKPAEESMFNIESPMHQYTKPPSNHHDTSDYHTVRSNMGRTDSLAQSRTKSMKQKIENIEIQNVTAVQTPSLHQSSRGNQEKPATALLPIPESDYRHPVEEPCNSCGKLIHLKRERYLEAAGGVYHLACFKCQVCHKQISYYEPFWQDTGRMREDGTLEDGIIMCQRDYEWLLRTKIKTVDE